jgi:gamma-glutamyl:cysteine ligase YbdK (ATP-grasp superfamily)
LLLLIALVAGAAAVLYVRSPKRHASWKEKFAKAIEGCPPVAKMAAIQRQNEEVASLLREQNELLRQRLGGRTDLEVQPV